MSRYEMLLLTIPEVTEDEIKGVESQLQTAVRNFKGTTVSFERWGKYRLAFPVKKNDYGVYFLARFELPTQSQDVINEIKSVINLKFFDIIMRSMVSKLEETDSLVYQRPPSLEEAPRRENTGSFFKSHKHAEGSDTDVENHEHDEGEFEGEEAASMTENIL